MSVIKSTDENITASSALMSRIQGGDTAAHEELIHFLVRSIRFSLARHIDSQDVPDAIHDVALAVLQAISRGQLRHSEALQAYARATARHYIAGYIDRAVHFRKRDGGCITLDNIAGTSHVANPEQVIIARERMLLANRVLASLKPNQQEILTRLYIEEQSPAEVCEEMRLTETQFRLLKSRAKATCHLLKKRAERVSYPLSAPLKGFLKAFPSAKIAS